MKTALAAALALFLYATPDISAHEEHPEHLHEGEGASSGAHSHDHDHAHDQGQAHNHELEKGHDHEHEHDHDHGHEGDPHAGHDHSGAEELVVVKADARSRHILNMQVESVPETSQALVHSLYGYLSVPGHALETYALPCAGRIGLHVKSAQQVKKGDLLYTLESPALTELLAELQTTRASLARCGVEIQAMESRLARLASIGSRNGDLEEQLKFKRAEQEQLRQTLDAADSRLRVLALGAKQAERNGIAVLEVRAHADGTVRNVGVSQGSWGEQGAPVITMSNLKAMEIAATLYASNVPDFSSVRATIPVGRDNIAVEGSWRMAEQPDPEKQTRALYFTPDSLPEGAQAGKLCRLDLYAEGDAHGMVSIPESAVVKVGVDDVVFVEVGEGSYAMVKVRAGASRMGMVPVAGLHPGQRIVVKGGYELKYILPGEGEKKKAGHFHADGKFHEGEDE